MEVEKTGNKNVLFIVSMKFCGVENEEKREKMNDALTTNLMTSGQLGVGAN